MRVREEVKDAIQRIYDRDGQVQTHVVVHEARKPNSPLHACFNWDDAKAAHEHRLLQARHLIKKVRVVIQGEESKLVHVRAKISESGEVLRENAYKPLSIVMSDDQEFADVLDDAVKRLEQAQGVVEELEALAEGREGSASDSIAAALRGLDTARENLEQLDAA